MNLSGMPSPFTVMSSPREATYSLTSLNRPPLRHPSSRVRIFLNRAAFLHNAGVERFEESYIEYGRPLSCLLSQSFRRFHRPVDHGPQCQDGHFLSVRDFFTLAYLQWLRCGVPPVCTFAKPPRITDDKRPVLYSCSCVKKSFQFDFVLGGCYHRVWDAAE